MTGSTYSWLAIQFSKSELRLNNRTVLIRRTSDSPSGERRLQRPGDFYFDFFSASRADFPAREQLIQDFFF
jgi:hypothetical protein